MINLKILIAALLITNAMTAAIVVKTQSCPTLSEYMEEKRAALAAETRRIKTPIPLNTTPPSVNPHKMLP